MAEVILSAYCVKMELMDLGAYGPGSLRTWEVQFQSPMLRYTANQNTGMTARHGVCLPHWMKPQGLLTGYSEGNSFHFKLTFNMSFQEKKKSRQNVGTEARMETAKLFYPMT